MDSHQSLCLLYVLDIFNYLFFFVYFALTGTDYVLGYISIIQEYVN